jgi:lactoylglutathione lyase
MTTRLAYVIRYVGDMEEAVRFYRDQLGLSFRFQSPGWSEFETGGTILALHPSSQENPAGTYRLGFEVPDVDRFYAEKKDRELEFTSAPTETFGRRIAKFKDSEGVECSVSGG